MSYKVNYYTLAIMEDGRTGNIKQETGVFFTDCLISEIPTVLKNYLEPRKRVGVIEKIDNVGGICL